MAKHYVAPNNPMRNDLPTGYDLDGDCLHPVILESGECEVCGEIVRRDAQSNDD